MDLLLWFKKKIMVRRLFYQSFSCMPQHIIQLPFPFDALSPNISETTINLHYTKHHTGYASKLDELIAPTDYAAMPLDQIIQSSHDRKDISIYNNAAQTWNHNFYWQSLCPSDQSHEPTEGDFFNAITTAGGFDSIVEQMVQIGVNQFASGWAWLVRTQDGTLFVRKTSNADPVWLNSSDHPLLVMDVWEHAYYVDYRNARPNYVDALLNNAVNWEFVAENLDGDGASRADQE